MIPAEVNNIIATVVTLIALIIRQTIESAVKNSGILRLKESVREDYLLPSARVLEGTIGRAGSGFTQFNDGSSLLVDEPALALKSTQRRPFFASQGSCDTFEPANGLRGSGHGDARTRVDAQRTTLLYQSSSHLDTLNAESPAG